MRALAFDAGELLADRRIRNARFEERSVLPVTAACVLANGVRETLARLFAAPVELRLLAPLAPSALAWRAITRDASLYRISGARSDAAIVLRPESRVGLAVAAFGEPAVGERSLSRLEETVLERIVTALLPNFSPICGRPAEILAWERAGAIPGFRTYFELLIERPVELRIGVALARDPAPEPHQLLTLEELAEVLVDVRVCTEGVRAPANSLAAIELGEIVPITEQTGLTAVATVAGRVIGRGECGVRGNRLALAIGLSPRTEGSSEPEP